MPTGRERDEMIRRAEERLRARRDAQQSGQGKGQPQEHDQFRHSGLLDPRDPGHNGKNKPVDVNVVGNNAVMHAMKAMSGGHGPTGTLPRPQHGAHPNHGLPAFGANITSPQGQHAASAQVLQQMKIQVTAAEQLARASQTHLDTMKKVYDQERDAVEELTQMLQQAAKTGVGTGSGAQGPAGGPGRSHGPHTSATPHAGSHGRAGGAAGHPGGHDTQHYDPAGLLSNGPIHGGARNSQMDLMTHLANGGTHDTFDPSQYMSAGRNHPTSYGELQRNLRVRAARAMNNTFGEPAKLPELTPQYDQQGELSHYNYNAKNGSPIERIEKDDPRRESLAKDISEGYQGVKMTSKVAGAVARGGLGAGLKAIPYVGTAIAVADGVNEAAEWVTDQRAANAQYQAIEGGTNFGTGVSERLKKFGNRLDQRFSGGMTGEQADQVFDTFTAQGFTGDQRSAYIKEASNQYKQTGADPMQTAQMVVTAANHANSGLVNLAASIQSVTQTAIQYGVSADQARQTMMTTMGQLAASGMQGSQLPAMAAVDTNMVTQMGRSLQGTSFAGMNNENTLRTESSMLGMPYSRFMSQKEDSPALGAKAQDEILNRFSGTLTNGAVKAAWDKEVAAAGGIDKVKNNGDLKRQVAKKVLDATGVDVSGTQRQWGANGITGPAADPTDPVSGMVQAGEIMMNGGQWSQNNEKQVEAQHQQRDETKGDVKNLHTDSRSTMQQIGDSISHWWEHPFDTSPHQTSENVNKQQEASSGKIDQTIDQLLDPAQGLGDKDNVGVKVTTKDGEKVVPMNTAISKYRDQVASGKATIVDPDDPSKDGKSVKDITGGAETNYKGPTTTGDAATSDAQDEDKFRQDHPATKGGDSGGGGQNVNVTVTPDKQLQGWFQFHTGNGGQTQSGAANGVPPQPGGTPTSGSGTP